MLATIAPLLVTYLHEPPLLGWPEALFLVLGGAGLVATLLRTRVWQAVVWLVVPVLVLTGVLVAGGTLGGYLLSRTVGLPGFREASWEQFMEPMGLASLAVEATFLVVAVLVYSEYWRGQAGDASLTELFGCLKPATRPQPLRNVPQGLF